MCGGGLYLCVSPCTPISVCVRDAHLLYLISQPSPLTLASPVVISYSTSLFTLIYLHRILCSPTHPTFLIQVCRITSPHPISHPYSPHTIFLNHISHPTSPLSPILTLAVIHPSLHTSSHLTPHFDTLTHLEITLNAKIRVRTLFHYFAPLLRMALGDRYSLEHVLDWSYGGVDPSIPGNGGAGCASFLSIHRRLFETLLGCAVPLFYVFWGYSYITCPTSYKFVR